MRSGKALLIAGIVISIAALSGPSLAAEDGGRTLPEAEVEAAPSGAGSGPLEAGPSRPAQPVGNGDGGRAPDQVDSEPVSVDDDEPVDGRKRDPAGEREARKQGTGSRADVRVRMIDIQFRPRSVTVSPGDEVTWRNFDTAQHNAVGQGGADFETPLLDKGETASVPFNEAGSFDYICTVHPSMTGTVVVRSSGAGSGRGSSDTAGTSSGGSGSGDTSAAAGSSSGSSSTAGSAGSSSGGGTLPRTGGVELPLLVFGSGLVVIGLLTRALHEYLIWR